MFYAKHIFPRFMVFQLLVALVLVADDSVDQPGPALGPAQKSCWSSMESFALDARSRFSQLEPHFVLIAERIYRNSLVGKTSQVTDLIDLYNQRYLTKYSSQKKGDFFQRVLNPLNMRLRKFFQGQKPLKFYTGNGEVYWDFFSTMASARWPGAFDLGPMELDFAFRALVYQGQLMALTPAEFELCALVRQEGGRVVSALELARNFPWETDAANLRVVFAKLKQKVSQQLPLFNLDNFPLAKVFLAGYRWQLSPQDLRESPLWIGQLALYRKSLRLFWQQQEVQVSGPMAYLIVMIANRQRPIADQYLIGELNHFASAYSSEQVYQIQNLRKMISRLRQEFRKIDPTFDCLQRISSAHEGQWLWRCR